MSFILLILLMAVAWAWLYRHFSKAEIIGKKGERQVARILIRLPDDYTVFNDVYINVDGHDNQIDHIVLSPYGIFVIETKRYSGWIYGSEKAQYWAKNVYGQKYEFYNPLRQNFAHVMALRKLLELPQAWFFPIVVFAGNVELQSEFPHNTVIYIEELRDEILSHTEALIPEDILKKAINKLTYSSFTTRDTASDHLKAIRETINRRDIAINNGLCPQCGGTLVYRQGKYGDFWGCSNYPQCHFTLKV